MTVYSFAFTFNNFVIFENGYNWLNPCHRIWVNEWFVCVGKTFDSAMVC